jgi:hypothetical protein
LNTTELRQRAKRAIDELSGNRLRLATDILDYVADRTSADATKELLDIPGFLQSFRRGAREVRDGMTQGSARSGLADSGPTRQARPAKKVCARAQ